MVEVLHEMLGYYGLKEVDGSNSNPQILAIFDEIGYDWVSDDSETAWCSAALNYFCKRTGYERSGKLDARSWLKVGEEITTPELGDIVVLWRESKNSWKGHVGLYITEDNGIIQLLGGNQGDMIKISPYSKKRVLGYRRVRKLTDLINYD